MHPFDETTCLLKTWSSAYLGSLGVKYTLCVEFEKKAVGHIENLINQNGGIGGLPIQIDFVNINKI